MVTELDPQNDTDGNPLAPPSFPAAARIAAAPPMENAVEWSNSILIDDGKDTARAGLYFFSSLTPILTSV